MNRSVVWVVAGLAIAGVAAFLLFGGDGDPQVEGDFAIGESGPAASDEAGPALRTTGRQPDAVPLGGRGRFTLKGTVEDVDGNAQADVPVVAYRTGVAWIQSDPSTWHQGFGATIARSLDALADPAAEAHPAVARTTTDEHGAFVLRVDRAARYDVAAHPEPPRVGTRESGVVHDQQPEHEATLRVLDGSALKGRVIDTNDRPVAAVVRASWSDRNVGMSSHHWRSQAAESSAEDGAFAFAAVPNGTVRLSVSFAHRGNITGYTVKTPHEGVYEIRVGAGGDAITGLVSDAAGSPIAGARMLLSVRAGKEGDKDRTITRLAGLSAADGRYRIEGFPEGDVQTVQALAEGYLAKAQWSHQASWKGIRVTVGKDTELDIKMERGGRVHGLISAQGDKAPIEGATVELLTGRNQARGRPLATKTDAQGRYDLEGVPAGRYVLLPRHPDYYLSQVAFGSNAVSYNTQGSTAPAALTVVIIGDESRIERDVELLAGLPVRGRVLGPKDKPVEGAEIFAKDFGINRIAHAWGVMGAANRPLATSAADGTFATQGLPPKEGWLLYAKKKGLTGRFSDAVALAAGSPAPTVELRLQEGATVRGRIVCEAKEDVGSAQVGLWGQQSELSGSNSFKRVNADGTFELTDIAPGDWTINLWMNGRAGMQKPVTGLKAGEVRDGVDLVLTAGCEVSGMLVDKDGKGVAQISLMLQSMQGGGYVQANSKEDGSFTFQGVKPGMARLTTWGSGKQRTLVQSLQAPTADLRVVYEREVSVTITGEVHDPSGARVALSLVRISNKGSAPPRYQPYSGDGIEALDGKFSKRVTGKGPFWVHVTKPRDEQGKSLNLKPARHKVEDPSKPVVIRLERGAEVRGRVLDAASDEPIANIAVSADGQQVETDAKGAYALTGLGGKTIRVSLMTTGTYIRPEPKSVPAGSDNVDFHLTQGLKIRGRAIGPDGKGASRGHASAQWPKGPGHPAGHASATLGPKGSFVLEGLPAAAVVRVQVQVWHQGGSEAAYAPAVQENVRPGTEDLELRLGSGLTIEGIVLDHAGKPATAGFVHARAKGGSSMSSGWAQLTGDGTWKLAGLNPGTYMIHVQRQDGGVQPKPVAAEAGAAGVRITLPRSSVLTGRIEGLGKKDTGWTAHVFHGDGTSAGATKVKPGGVFTFTAIEADKTYTVGAAKRGDNRYALKERVRAGSKNIVLTLQEGQRITGTIDLTGIDEGARCYVSTKALWTVYANVNTETGVFAMEGLPPGRYDLSARAGVNTTKEHVGERKGVEAGSEGVTIPMERK